MELADLIGSIVRHWKVAVGLLAASLLVLAIFLVTRNEVLPETRFQASALILIPAPDDKGVRPEGVPPVLLQGQLSLADNSKTRDSAGQFAKLTKDQINDVEYSSSQNDTLDIVTLSARAGTDAVAETAARGYADAYISARSRTVGSGARTRQQKLKSGVFIYRGRLVAIEAALKANLSASAAVGTTPTGSNGSATTSTTVPEGVPQDVALLLAQQAALRTSITSAEEDFARAEIQALTPSPFATVVEQPPVRRLTPPPPSPLIPSAVALGIGVLLALVVPVLMDRFDHTVKDSATAQALLGAPVLATIPALRAEDRMFLAEAGSEQDRSYRSLAARSIATDRLPRAIIVMSPSSRVQDPVAANFAAALADLGLKVALVATSPEQQWFVDAGDERSRRTLPDMLADAHAGMPAAELGLRLSPSMIENLFVIPPGEATSEQPIVLDGLPPLLAGLEEHGIDVTVLAGPPLLEDPDATIFAWSTRSVMWAVEAGEVSQVDARESATRLELAGVAPFGVAVVGAPD